MKQSYSIVLEANTLLFIKLLVSSWKPRLKSVLNVIKKVIKFFITFSMLNQHGSIVLIKRYLELK